MLVPPGAEAAGVLGALLCGEGGHERLHGAVGGCLVAHS